ncbi:cysteine-rich repeat secretory protein 38-like [Quercus lobata]|uniref:cysteine-rich repeat secretory protein 38-like n=1 Tax=Quercus lobata TaxID=97700 RepID=UPI00124410FA|nr:cysteine-rich repeat secretory protein 38-like [Quercus lobata]
MVLHSAQRVMMQTKFMGLPFAMLISKRKIAKVELLMQQTKFGHFGHIDHETWFFTKDPQNLTNCQSIRQKKSEWLTQLAGQASINPPMVLFGELDIGENNKLNGSVRRTRDFSSLDCMKCLSDSIGFVPKCCDSSKAVRLFSGTCELRFEAYYNKA